MKTRKIIDKCLQCGSTESTIINTLSKGTYYRSGYYRIKCDTCDFIRTVKTLHPDQEEHPEELDLDEIANQEYLDKQIQKEDE